MPRPRLQLTGIADTQYKPFYDKDSYMSDNKCKQNSLEEQVFKDVIDLSKAVGGYKKKAALKLNGSVDTNHECPDIVVTRCDGSIIGLEHFRIDHHIKQDRAAQSKSAELMSLMIGRHEKLKPMLGYDDNALDEMAKAVAEFVAKEQYHRRNACCDDLTHSLDVRLFDKKAGHALKLAKYRNRLMVSHRESNHIELGYLIEIHSDFQGLFLHEGAKLTRLIAGQCPLYAELFDLLHRASTEVDWILIGFYPCLADRIVDAAIIDCRHGLFKNSCHRQHLNRTEYLGLGKTKPFIKQKREGETRIERHGEEYTLYLENPSDDIESFSQFKNAINDTARALNLNKVGIPFTTTISVQLIYELAWMRKNRFQGTATEITVLQLLSEIGPIEFIEASINFREKYDISDERNLTF